MKQLTQFNFKTICCALCSKFSNFSHKMKDFRYACHKGSNHTIHSHTHTHTQIKQSTMKPLRCWKAWCLGRSMMLCWNSAVVLCIYVWCIIHLRKCVYFVYTKYTRENVSIPYIKQCHWKLKFTNVTHQPQKYTAY